MYYTSMAELIMLVGEPGSGKSTWLAKQDMINAGDNQFTIGSIIIPVTELNGRTNGKFYTWMTYKVAPSALKVAKPEIEVDIGEVPVTMTEKEGRDIDIGYSGYEDTGDKNNPDAKLKEMEVFV